MLLLLISSAGAVGPATAEEAVSEEIEVAKEKLAKWVEIRRIISREERDLVLAKEMLQERIELVRGATAIVEEELREVDAFQCLAILHEDRVTGMRGGKRDFGHQIEVRCWDSTDAVTGTPTELPFQTLRRLADRITAEVPGVVSVTYNIAPKPPSCIEAV
jgi:hypothetical protein